LIDDLAKQLARHKLVPFFGAGASSQHLGGIWKDISDAMADELGLPTSDRADFLDVAEKYEQKFGKASLSDFLSSRLIAKDFDDAKGRNHLLLLSFAAGVLYTTNQDNLFELAAAKKGRPHRIIVELEDLGALLPGEFALVKYHGDLAKPNSVIFTRSSYQQRIADVDHFLNIRMRSDLLAKGFLFIGYSFNDPNVRLLFDQVQAAFRGKTPQSYLIAYRYDPTMEVLTNEFSVRIINPLEAFPGAKDGGEAFERYLSALNKKVVEHKVASEIDTIFRPSVPTSARVATTYDVDGVVAAVQQGNFKSGLNAFRAKDQTVVPDDLLGQVGKTFRALADQAKTVDDLQNLAAALFNLHMSPEHILDAAAGIIVAINRVNPSGNFLPFMLMCPAAPDYVMALAAAAAAAEIRDKGGKINDGFRINAMQWLDTFNQLPDNLKELVRQQMEAAGRDGGRSLPPHILGKGSLLPLKTFSELKNDLQSMIPKRFAKPYD
jgi:hypothetical protein